MAIHNRLTQTLAIEHPVLLAPMGVVSGGSLAAAVSRAGGLGMLGAGYGDRYWIAREWARAGNARIGCGFITWSMAKRPWLLSSVLLLRPAAVMLSYGDPRPFGDAIRTAGARLICQVQSVAQACEAREAGADIIVAQGTEAGGYGLFEPLFTLLPKVVGACPDIPVVAAGGVADGRGLAAAIMMGAEGVLMGTRFYASQEAEGDLEVKRCLLAAGSGQTVRATVFGHSSDDQWPAPYTCRVLRNRNAARLPGTEAKLEAHCEASEREHAKAGERGHADGALVIAGESCSLIKDIPPAGDIVSRIVMEAERLIVPYRRDFC
jgi:nitronate monooxygenase